MRKGHLNNPPLGQIITYTEVIANEGQGMVPNTGIFVVPISGLYSFTFSALTEKEGHYTYVQVCKNIVHLFNIHSNPQASSEESYENLTFSWYMSLTKDDKIFLRMNANGKTLHVKDAFPVVFSGHLLMAQ